MQQFFNQKSQPLLTPSHPCFWSANDGYSIISFSGLKTSRSTNVFVKHYGETAALPYSKVSPSADDLRPWPGVAWLHHHVRGTR